MHKKSNNLIDTGSIFRMECMPLCIKASSNHPYTIPVKLYETVLSVPGQVSIVFALFTFVNSPNLWPLMISIRLYQL